MAAEHESPLRPDTGSTAVDTGIHWASILRNTVLIVVLLILLWVAFNVRLPSADSLQDMIASWGWAAWLVFVGTYAVVALTPIPVTVMAITGGLLFGTITGTILSVIGVFIGCWGAYWIARGLGQEAIAKLLGPHYKTAEQHLDQAGFHAVVMLRLLPGFPYWPVNYGSGAFGVSQRDFILATALASIPGQVSLVAIGSFISDPTVTHGVVVGIGWLVVLVMTWWAYRRWKTIKDQTAQPADH